MTQDEDLGVLGEPRFIPPMLATAAADFPRTISGLHELTG